MVFGVGVATKTKKMLSIRGKLKGLNGSVPSGDTPFGGSHNKEPENVRGMSRVALFAERPTLGPHHSEASWLGAAESTKKVRGPCRNTKDYQSSPRKQNQNTCSRPATPCL